jgi:hypothetical protein
MPFWPVRNSRVKIMLCMMSLFATHLSLRAETASVLPIGKLATSGTVSIGNVLAPTGTALFSGDHLSAQDSPALISLSSGSSVALTRGAAATFFRKGTTLLVQAERGIIGFHFVPGEEARIEAGHYRFTASTKEKARVGELAIGADGRVAMLLSRGGFSALDTKSERSFAVSADSQAKPEARPTGKGTLANDTNRLSDPSQRWPENSLRNRCIVVRGEAHRIVANKTNALALSGAWLLFSGTYEYTITDCTEQALADAGAAIGVEEALAVPAAAPPVQAPSTGMSGGTKAAIAAGVAGGAAAGIAVAISRRSKSP